MTAKGVQIGGRTEGDSWTLSRRAPDAHQIAWLIERFLAICLGIEKKNDSSL